VQQGILIDCPRSLIESWWIKLQERGFTVDLTTPLTVELPPEKNGVRYRQGTAERHDTVIDVLACPGPPSSSPLSGKHILVLTFRSEQTKQLASLIGQVLVELGGSQIEPPGGFP